MIKKIINKIIRLIFFSQKDFFLPKKNKIIILDEVGSQKIKYSLLGKKKFTILNVRDEKINVPILLLSMLNIFKYGKYSYKITFLNYVGAKIALSYIDTSFHFCFFMKKVKNCKLILIQNGRRQEKKEIQPYIKINKDDLKFDYYFVFNKYYAQLMQNYLKTKFIIGGSILNNLHRKNEKFSKIKRIQYISNFSIPENFAISYNEVNYFKYFVESNKFILEAIYKFCLEKKLILEIIGRQQDKNFIKREIEFYKKFNVKFKFLKKEKENYTKISNDSIVTGLNSTLLGELFARNFRVAFFDIQNSFFPIFNKKFGFCYPKTTKDHGLFWSNKPDANEIRKNLIFLYSVNFKKWRLLVSNWSKYIVVHNYGNIIYKNILNKIGV